MSFWILHYQLGEFFTSDSNACFEAAAVVRVIVKMCTEKRTQYGLYK